MASRGPSLPRITDVAALAGVSTSTASKALNDTGQLREETRERVRRAAEQLGFTPDGRGRALSSGRSFTVGLITTDSSGRFSIPIMLGAEDTLSAGEMALILCDTRDDPLREQHLLRSSPSTEPSDTSVIVDDHGGAASTVQHLLSLGRRRIAHVSGPAAHQSAMTRAAATVETAGDALVGKPMHGEWSERWGRHVVDVLLRSTPELDAISCGSDQIARGVCDRLRELGRSVPDDIAVTGYDNWSVMALASRPPLTTVDLKLEELGRRTANLLLDSIAGSRHPGLLEMPTRLVTRESTLGT